MLENHPPRSMPATSSSGPPQTKAPWMRSADAAGSTHTPNGSSSLPEAPPPSTSRPAEWEPGRGWPGPGGISA